MALDGLGPFAPGNGGAKPVHHHHALGVAHLPPHHRDPFDRLLVVQATIEGVPILSSDRVFRAYEVEVIPA